MPNRPPPWTEKGQQALQKRIENRSKFTMGSGSNKRPKKKTKNKGELLNASVVSAGEIVEGLIIGIVEGLIFVVGLR